VRPTRGRADEPVLITEAQPSLDSQFHARRKKYTIMMGTRAICLVLAAVSYRTWWLMAIFVVGAVVLPWMAVIIANDRPARKALKVSRYLRHPRPDRAIDAPPAQRRVIEG
jgi:Flp pilus assembly protein TadB